MQKSNTNFDAIILGGGSAGWLTALWIKKYWPKLEITVVENPKKPPIIAGESGTTTFVQLLNSIDIDIKDFVEKVNATPKLAGKFTDWNGVGTEFIHCLQTDYAPWLDGWTDYIESGKEEDQLVLNDLVRILQRENSKDTYLKTLIGNNIPLADAFYAQQFVKEQKVPFGYKTTDLPIIPMWHFESRSAAAYFKKLGIERGIKIIEGEYTHSTTTVEGIKSIHLDDGQQLCADWFFDCSGFARLLLEKEIKEPVIDYSNYFPARAVVAWWDDPCYCVSTNAIAMKYGWSWNINLRHRSGNGYLYDPDYLNLDQAIKEAETRFDKKIEPIANFSFQPGMMRNTWSKNVIAIGLSNGFLEPLEANGIAVIIESLYALQDHWRPSEKGYVSQRFNDRTWAVSEDIKDFLALHYRGKRRDTEFWQSHANDSIRIPHSLQEKLEQWREWYSKGGGQEPVFNGYSSTAWLMVLQALEVFDYHDVKQRYSNVLETGKIVLNNNTLRYKELVAPFLTIDEWVSNYDK